MLGKYNQEPNYPNPLPLHLLDPLVKIMSQDHYVNDEGEIVFYQADPNIKNSRR